MHGDQSCVVKGTLKRHIAYERLRKEIPELGGAVAVEVLERMRGVQISEFCLSEREELSEIMKRKIRTI